MVVFFAATVFAGAGLGNSAAIATVAVGIANLLGTFVAAVMTDRLGRRPLLIRSFSAMAACLTVLVASQLPQVANSSPLLAAGAAVACIPAFMVCFASGVGPVVYLLYSEVGHGRANRLAPTSHVPAALPARCLFEVASHL